MIAKVLPPHDNIHPYTAKHVYKHCADESLVSIFHLFDKKILLFMEKKTFQIGIINNKSISYQLLYQFE